jgi:UDP-N-acetylmuramoyl-L-alanyl-D-glutamate--2,6-diaminopimelate ligase
MNLDNLISKLALKKRQGDQNPEIKGIAFDSRLVSQGFLFVAVKGNVVDGHDYIEQAIRLGANSIVCQEIPQNPLPEIAYLKVENSAEALAKIAAEWFGNPSECIDIVGITGTNGKTSTATLLYTSLSSLGFKCGLLSTVANFIGNREINATHTTPDPISLNRLLREMVDEGCSYCFMEVSSHAVDQHRIDFLNFKGAVFTNLTHDHLDYHKTFDQYLKAKKRWFDMLPPTAFAIVNCDDRNGLVMVQNCNAKKYTYGLMNSSDYHAKVLENHMDGQLVNFDGNECWLPFVGRFNAYNLLAVYSVMLLLGFGKSEILRILSNSPKVKGRFETLVSPGGVLACIDYAHTPDALRNVLETINEVREYQGKLITVMGAGGDRDKSKRPEMGRIAARFSNRVIITSDNPRSEDPEAIIQEIEAGVEPENMSKVVKIINRREAIRTAVMLAQKGDVIAICGKGHEHYQEIKGVRHHFDDREEIQLVLGSIHN